MDYYIGIGGNEGDVLTTFRKAIFKISEDIAHVLRISKCYRSNPLPTTHGLSQQEYLNAVIFFQSLKKPEEVLDILLQIELSLGRDRSTELIWGPRTIDLDIISCDDLVINSPGLRIPHRRMAERDFVLVPLIDLDPEWFHPESKLSIKEILERLAPGQQYISGVVDFSL